MRRTGATVDALEALAAAGAFEQSFGQSRRSAMWAAGALRDARRTCLRSGTVVETLPGLLTGLDAPPLPGMTEPEEVASDLWSMGLSPGRHPTEFVRGSWCARVSSPPPTCGCFPTVPSSRWRVW